MTTVGRRLTTFASSDTVIALLVFAVVSVLAFAYFKNEHSGHFYQNEFAPAVNFACNGTFENLSPWDVRNDGLATRKLADFLAARSETFDCSDWPAAERYRAPLSNVQRGILNLITTAGLIWSVTGIAWSELAIIAAVLGGAFAAGVYRLCRLFVPAALALAVMAATLLAPMHLAALPSLRNYSKAPFIIWSIYFLGVALTTSSPRALLVACSLAGLTSGIGLGFRNDLTLVPLFVLAMMLVFAFGDIRHRWRPALLGLGVYAICFMVASLPVLLVFRGSGPLGHVVLLGLTLPFDRTLGLTRSVYDVGAQYADSEIRNFLYASAFMRLGAAAHDRVQYFVGSREVLDYLTPFYGRMALWTLLDYAVLFPADILTRAFAAFLRIARPNFSLPFLGEGVGWLGAWAFGLALVIVTGIRPVLGIFLACFVAYFTATTALQFEPRHAFHLGFIPVLSLAIVFAALLSLLASRLVPAPQTGLAGRLRESWRRLALPPLPGPRFFAIALVAAIALIGGGFLALTGLRQFQQTRVLAAVERVLAAPREPVALREVDEGVNLLLRPVGRLPDLAGVETRVGERLVDTFYLAASFEPRSCPGRYLQLQLAYRAPESYADPTRTLAMVLGEPDGERAYFVFPIYSAPRFEFEGFRIKKSLRKCLRAIEAIRTSEALSLPLWLQLFPGWRNEALYQSLTDPPWPSGRPSTRASFAFSGMRGNFDRIVPLPRDAWTLLPPARWRPDALAVQGTPASPQIYAAVTKPLPLNEGALVVATGVVRSGGLTIGLVEKGQWVTSLLVGPGPFAVVVPVPRDGDYSIVIANNLQASQANDVAVTTIGLLGARLAPSPQK